MVAWLLALLLVLLALLELEPAPVVLDAVLALLLGRSAGTSAESLLLLRLLLVLLLSSKLS